MKAQYLKTHPENPEQKKINNVVQVLKNGGIIIYPTDTIYGIGCDLFNRKAVSKLVQILGIRSKDLNLSFICADISQISEYTRQLPSNVFKVLRKALPGPYTFILPSSSKVPKLLDVNKSTVGIRVPDNKIPLSIVETLGNPIISASIKDEDSIVEYTTDPSLIYERFSHKVDIVVDGGHGRNTASTILDCTGTDIEVVRMGAGDLSIL
ncbi:MAG: threonylcarbamoyl-AMP synthase [Cyclobacteriaceae bacterium]|nr:threonylcarbamoyl-AMP synthase [Cyclobacteriaceae bacterium]